MIQRGKIKRPQKLLWLFLPHLYLQNIRSGARRAGVCVFGFPAECSARHKLRGCKQPGINKACVEKREEENFPPHREQGEAPSQKRRHQSPGLGRGTFNQDTDLGFNQDTALVCLMATHALGFWDSPALKRKV